MSSAPWPSGEMVQQWSGACHRGRNILQTTETVQTHYGTSCKLFSPLFSSAWWRRSHHSISLCCILWEEGKRLGMIQSDPAHCTHWHIPYSAAVCLPGPVLWQTFCFTGTDSAGFSLLQLELESGRWQERHWSLTFHRRCYLSASWGRDQPSTPE